MTDTKQELHTGTITPLPLHERLPGDDKGEEVRALLIIVGVCIFLGIMIGIVVIQFRRKNKRAIKKFWTSPLALLIEFIAVLIGFISLVAELISE